MILSLVKICFLGAGKKSCEKLNKIETRLDFMIGWFSDSIFKRPIEHHLFFILYIVIHVILFHQLFTRSPIWGGDKLKSKTFISFHSPLVTDYHVSINV